MTTAYNLINTVIWSRNRSSATSTSVSITWSVFESSLQKDLSISVAIDVYNHYMSEIDIANQYQTAFITLQHQSNHYWKSLFNWFLDIALVNSYLLAKAIQKLVIEKSKLCHHHQWFQEVLAKILIIYTEISEHNKVLRLNRVYCVYCQKHQLNWESKHQQWSFGTNITNIGGGSGGGSGGRFRGSRTNWGCDACNIPLCKIGDCWDQWHRRFN